MCLDSVKVGITNRQVTEVVVGGFYVYLVAAACTGLEVGAVCSQERSWEKGSP